jgi:hypothetical protein
LRTRADHSLMSRSKPDLVIACSLFGNTWNIGMVTSCTLR